VANKWRSIETYIDSAGDRNYVLLYSPAHGRVIGAHIAGDVWHLIGVGCVSSPSERPTHWMPLPDFPSVSVLPVEPAHDKWCISRTTNLPCDCELAPHRAVLPVEGPQELRAIAQGLVSLDWCIGYELTEAQHVELDNLRDRALAALRVLPHEEK
jgi:hypothetical protein